MSFVNLHTHSHYSLLDGFGSPEAIVLRAKELGYPAAALTDHGVSYGLVEFYKAAHKHNVKPILGCEMYIAPRTRFDKEAKIDVRPYHLTLLAKNNTGYQNLLKLISKANLEGFYYKPRIDYGLLKTYGDGLIALSGCLAGHLPRLILSNDTEAIENLLKTHLEIFGNEDYYLEMQDHPLIEDQEIVNEKLKELSKSHNIELVATNDTHYPRPQDSDAHDLLLCIQTQTTVNEENRMRYVGDYSIREYKDLQKAFSDTPKALENTLKIADKCNVVLEFGKNLIPSYKTPQNEKPDIYLRKLCEEGLATRFGKKKMPKKYQERLDYELQTVHRMGFDTYFLIVHDFVRYAKDNKIIVGPGRGSAAGSIIAWSLTITDLDPIEYGLFFERFLNPDRVSMPDIDIDFADNRRDEVLSYVIEKYGRNNVAQIITFGTMAPRAAIRDAGRALGYPYPDVDKLAKIVPAPILGRQSPLKVSIKEDPDLKQEYEKDEKTRTLVDYAIELEGTVRHAGTHACAVVISDKPLENYTALQFGASKSDEVITQYSMKPIEELGLLKMDFLGLRNLTIIGSACKIIKRTRKKNIDIENIPLDDKATFKLLQKADTTGVFQLESPGMRRYLKQLKPTIFDDIVAMGALYRPRPMEWIPTYIKGKHNPDKIKYLHKSFKSILESTYGVAVYQEQILQLARDFAGFSLGEADILRKAVGKKIISLLNKQREQFIKGAIKNGHDKKFAEKVFEKVIEPFAGYGFNKAHAACYGLIAYRTAYLKAHFPIEFMTALLCSDVQNTDRLVLEIKECNEKGVQVLPPSINESLSNFTVVDDKTIRFGLTAIKGVGEGPVKLMVDERKKNGEFKSLVEFASRVPAQVLNKKSIQALAYSGALDEFGDRNVIAENYEEISKFAKNSQELSMNGQTNIFAIMDDDEVETHSLELKNIEPASKIKCLQWEKQFLGMYVTSHPLHGLKKYISKKANLIGLLTEKNLNKYVSILGIASEIKRILTKAGSYMVTFKLEDITGRVNVVLFPKVFLKFGELINEDQIIGISGKLDNRRGQCQVACDSLKVLSLENMIQNAKDSNVFQKDEKMDFVIKSLDDILEPPEDSEEEEAAAKKVKAEEKAKKAEVFLIEIPEAAGNDVLSSLNELLMSNKGDTPVELFLRSANKRLKLPFNISVSEKLKTNIDKLFV